MEKKKLELATIEISKTALPSVVSDITDIALHDALTTYFTAIALGTTAKWNEYEALTEAVRVMSNEMVSNANGKKVQRFAKAKDLYKFLHLDDSKGDLALKTIEYNSRRLWHDYHVQPNGALVYHYHVDTDNNPLFNDLGEYVNADGVTIGFDGLPTDTPIKGTENDNKPLPIMVSYKDMGFNVSKVNELRKADDEGNVANLVSYIHDKDNDCNGIRYLMELSDKSLKDLIKAWYADGTPEHAPTPKKPNIDDINDKVNNKADTGKADTGKADTGKADTGKADTGKADTGKADTGKANKPTVEDTFKDPREVMDYIKRYLKVVDRKTLFEYLLTDFGITSVRIDKKGNVTITNR